MAIQNNLFILLETITAGQALLTLCTERTYYFCSQLANLVEEWVLVSYCAGVEVEWRDWKSRIEVRYGTKTN